ncbi:hypothetical protein B0J13DRAFT_664531 [Dactylonectria estremocensis]|uniref:Uncharacterized protein n=1 Tax=Dactylonectria estremocensis TaxID=1079267 RepID=A0A9P9J2W5_9HYPO|nr:hypothetical protein B0J13DRAFT_664531 [Dactylonectria estremocensis]
MTLEKDGWIDSVIDRIDLIYNPHPLLDNNPEDKEYEAYTHCKLSWRGTSVVQTLDCFHEVGNKYKEYAEKWQSKNDSIMAGPSSPFSKQDKRLLWGSYDDWELGKQEVWKRYSEDADKYQKLGRTRGKANSNGSFTANPFAVSAIETKDA